ncbi:hypothetical protein Tco_0976047 [Tanacetum coccineum]|uniref:Uncharacterized protein n=1 Tax=Tanacetum coccineum TaxID=301880 RepID=A0ABQ5EG55_9ASTR
MPIVRAGHHDTKFYPHQPGYQTLESGSPRLLCLVVGGIVVWIVAGNYWVVVEKSGYIAFVVEVAIVEMQFVDRD